MGTCLLGCILQLSMISFVNSLSCYQCDSADDLRCSEELISKDLRSLPCHNLSRAKFCVKMTGIFGVLVQEDFALSDTWTITARMFKDQEISVNIVPAFTRALEMDATPLSV